MNKINKIPTIMLIPPQRSSLPTTDGGIEMLITNMIKVNEIEKKVIFIIPSIYEKNKASNNFSHTKIYYFRGKKAIDRKIKNYKIIYYFLSCIIVFFKKLLFNRFTYPIFHKGRFVYPNLFLHQCLAICKIEKVDYVVNESCCLDFRLFKQLINFVGEDNFYYRIHNCTPAGSLEERSIFKNSISLSNRGKDRWISLCDVQGDNRVVYNAIDLSLYNKVVSQDEILELRKKIELPTDSTILFFCGRISPIKGVKELIDAFEMLDKKNVILIICGTTTLEHEKQYFESILKRIKNNKEIRYLGYFPNKELYLLYKIVDIQIVPTMCEEAAGLVAVEAMANGKPLIVTDSGGMTEYVDPNCAVILPNNKNIVKNLFFAMKDLIENKDKRLKMGENGMLRSQKFSKENNYFEFVKIFEK